VAVHVDLRHPRARGHARITPDVGSSQTGRSSRVEGRDICTRRRSLIDVAKLLRVALQSDGEADGRGRGRNAKRDEQQTATDAARKFRMRVVAGSTAVFGLELKVPVNCRMLPASTLAAACS
jgi:hypothetical protein